MKRNYYIFFKYVYLRFKKLFPWIFLKNNLSIIFNYISKYNIHIFFLQYYYKKKSFSECSKILARKTTNIKKNNLEEYLKIFLLVSAEAIKHMP